MISIQSGEKLLEGKWVLDGNTVVADETCQRINRLVAEVLKFIGTDDSGWDSLYQDPADCRYWLLFYPSSGWHGGGPPTLKVLPPTEDIKKYGNRKNS